MVLGDSLKSSLKTLAYLRPLNHIHMKYGLFLFFSFAIISISIAQEAEQAKVREAFENYKNSILTDKGNEAVNWVDSNTLNYYSEMLEVTKHADSLEVNNLGILDKMMVFTIRARTSRQDILSFDAKKLLEYSINEGMVGKSSVQNLDIDTPKISENKASAQVITNGQTIPISFGFQKENGTWKIDLTSIFPTSEEALKNVQESSGKGENEFIIWILEMTMNAEIGNEIWQKVE